MKSLANYHLSQKTISVFKIVPNFQIDDKKSTRLNSELNLKILAKEEKIMIIQLETTKVHHKNRKLKCKV